MNPSKVAKVPAILAAFADTTINPGGMAAAVVSLSEKYRCSPQYIYGCFVTDIGDASKSNPEQVLAHAKITPLKTPPLLPEPTTSSSSSSSSHMQSPQRPQTSRRLPGHNLMTNVSTSNRKDVYLAMQSAVSKVANHTKHLDIALEFNLIMRTKNPGIMTNDGHVRSWLQNYGQKKHALDELTKEQNTQKKKKVKTEKVELEEFHVLNVSDYSKRKCNRALRHYATLGAVGEPTFGVGRDVPTSQRNLSEAMKHHKDTIIKIRRK